MIHEIKIFKVVIFVRFEIILNLYKNREFMMQIKNN
jgi:hypothetical protein